MQAVRLRVVAVAAVVGLMLTGCAQEDRDAVRVGDVEIDNARIEAISGPLAARLAGRGSTGELRQSVAELTVFLEVARRYAREKGVTPPDPDYAGLADQLQTTVDDPFVRLNAEVNAYRDALVANTPPRTPTEAEMRDVYQRFVAVAGPVATYDQIRDELLAFREYGSALALRDELTAAMDRYDVDVDPRYQPLEFGLFVVSAQGDQLALVSLPMGQQGTGAVRAAD